MSGEYFAEFKTGVNNAWKVGLGNWVAFSGVPPVVLAGSVPTVPFRVAIITEAITSHTDVAGIVKVNDEELTFTRATRLTTEEELTSWPTITLTGLDCKITVELISVDGEYLQNETLTPIEIICFPKTRILRDRSGSGWQQTNYTIYCENPMSIGDQIRFLDPHQGRTIDVYIENDASGVDLEDNSQPFRVYDCA
jgi:hypothetical protein